MYFFTEFAGMKSQNSNLFLLLPHEFSSGKMMLSQTSGQLTAKDGKGTMAPKVLHHTTEVIGEEGDDNVQLRCAAQANPVPKYQWLKEVEPGKLSPLTTDGRVVTLDGTLIIMRPTVSDSCRYVCLVTNSLGNARCELNLIVKQTLVVNINPETSLVTVSSGESLLLNCSVRGFPLNVIKWKKDLKLIKEVKSDRQLRPVKEQISTKTLAIQIASFERKDAGVYQCFAENDWQSQQSSVQITFVDEAPSFEATFSEQTLDPGNSLSLSCSATGNPLPQITWTLDETAFASSHRVRYGDYVTRGKKVTSYVNITNTRVEDGGLYRCIASNSVSTISHQSRVNIRGAPSVKAMKNVTALEGESLHLYCPVFGFPIKKISWKKDNNLLPLHGQHTVYSNGSLFITNVNRKINEGFYSCAAENEQGFKGEANTYVKVIVGPRIDQFFFAKGLEEGMRSVAVCAVLSGDPPIRISWLKDGHNLDKDFGASIEMINSFTSTISFHSLSPQHSGNYTCLATNAASKDNFTAELVVKVPPFWVKEPTDTEVLIGQRLVLDCQANGFPEPQIRWKRMEDNNAGRSSPFKTIISNPHMHILENGSLLINQIVNGDEGQFMCQASNGVNPSLSKVITLKVNSPPRFAEKFVSNVVHKNSPLRLQCNASGNAPISYHWKKDDLSLQQTLDAGRYKITTNRNSSILLIESLSRLDSTLFTCKATNTYGVDEISFRIIVQETPEAPFNVNLQGANSNSVTISWSQPYNGNSPLLEYIIEYKLSDEIAWTHTLGQISKPATSLNALIANLMPSRSYDIRISCKNSIGKSNYSDILTAKTLEEAPSAPPTAVEMKATGSSSVKLLWSKPQHKNVVSIKGYYVGYRVYGSGSKFNLKSTEATSNSREEFVITGLKKATKYEAKVQAYNSAGNGPFGETTIAETMKFDPPKAAVLSVTKTSSISIEVEWSVSEEETITGFILHYKAEDGDWIQEHLSAVRNCVIDGLKCGTKYYIFVRGMNDAGVGEPSDTIIVKTDGSAPVAPEKSSFLTANSTAVSLNLHSWQSGCPIVHFDVHYKQQGDTEWTLFKTNVPAYHESLEITSLNPGSWYSLLMRAVNDAGTTDAEYVFATLLTSGATIPPLLIRSNPEPSLKLPFLEKWLLEKLSIILPIVCLFMVFVLGSAIICCFRLKSNGQQIRRNDRSLNTSVSDSEFKGESVCSPLDMSVASLKTNSNTPDTRMHLDQIQNLETADTIYYPSPYAFSRINDYNIDANTNCEDTYKMHPINRSSSIVSSTFHNYDTPIFVKRAFVGNNFERLSLPFSSNQRPDN
ncbi:cell adhesion molecule-like protein [Leptotrombidium deliense]|uniref:Cell adhesion molecule-like protein n=1 Tax=Leptotrombidium deliense TaxID=299467 RepID=A0A443SUY6_9ACAR|nr:cell adhesion molecule-like protein [Leptotrombidium deliense]